MRRVLVIALLMLWIVISASSQEAGLSSSILPALPDAPKLQIAADQDLQKLMRPNPALSHSSEQQAGSALDGIRAQLHLVNEVSSKLPNGAVFQARLEEPLIKNGQELLPRGTVFEGHVQTRHARHAMRPGSVFMTFDRVLVPGGSAQAVNLNLLGADDAAVKTDEEGGLHPALSKKRLVIQLGGTALAAKFADDLAQVAGGTAVSAATARYIGMAAATTFFLLQKGREVKLRPGDMIEVEFGRSGPLLDVGPANK